MTGGHSPDQHNNNTGLLSFPQHGGLVLDTVIYALLSSFIRKQLFCWVTSMVGHCLIRSSSSWRGVCLNMLDLLGGCRVQGGGGVLVLTIDRWSTDRVLAAAYI